MVKYVPCAVATDCKSLYDLCTKVGSMPEEKRVALDLLDVREGLEEYGDCIRWVPTEHMLADCLTKRMPPDLLLKFLRDNKYSFKFSEEILREKTEAKQRRKKARLVKAAEAATGGH